MKVLHLPTSVGGNSWGLSQGEKSLGLESTVLVKSDTNFKYPADINLRVNKLSILRRLLREIYTFLSVRNRYDVFHFNAGSSLVELNPIGLSLLDLPFYPKNKKIVVTYNGCDARQKYPTMDRATYAACHEKECYSGRCNSGKLDKMRRKRIKKFAKYADHIFSVNPDLLHFLPEKASFIPYSIAGWNNIQEVPFKIDRTIRIVHSPTERAAKGSGYILNALEKLKSKYPQIEVSVIENLPHEKALELYRSAHIVVDQCLVGWYGAFAVETMKMGKPVAVFIREEDLKFIPSEMATQLKESIIPITPFTIEKALLPYLENPALLKAKSEASLRYVTKWHHPKYVAQIAKDIYEAS